MPAFRSVVSVLLRGWETFLYDPQVAPCGRPLRGRPRRRTPDGRRARIATLASCTASPASGRTSPERVRRMGRAGALVWSPWSHRSDVDSMQDD
jgi:hypothetical protein